MFLLFVTSRVITLFLLYVVDQTAKINSHKIFYLESSAKFKSHKTYLFSHPRNLVPAKFSSIKVARPIGLLIISSIGVNIVARGVNKECALS